MSQVSFIDRYGGLELVRRSWRTVLVLSVALLTVGCDTAIDDEWESYRKSVVRLVVDGDDFTSSGTAFAISEAGHYVTNFHVVEEVVADDIRLLAVESLVPARKEHPATVLWSDALRDLAVVHVPSWINEPLALLPSDEVRVNLAVLSIGFPGSSDALSGMMNAGWTVPTLKNGIVSESIDVPLEEEEGSWGLLEHSAVVNSGNSGGPLVDECGRVVGVNVAKASSSVDIAEALAMAAIGGYAQSEGDIQEGAYFAIRSDDLRAALDAQSIPYTSRSRSCFSGSLGVEALLGGIAALVCLFATAMLAMFLYFRRKLPDTPFDMRTASRMIITGVLPEREPEVPAPPEGARVYRGEGGEILHVGSLRLSSVSGHAQSAELIPDSALSLGRDPNATDLTVLDDRVSRVHARVTLGSDGTVRVVDLNSTHGTFIDGQKVDNEAPGTVMGREQRLLLGSEGAVFMLVESGK